MYFAPAWRQAYDMRRLPSVISADRMWDGSRATTLNTAHQYGDLRTPSSISTDGTGGRTPPQARSPAGRGAAAADDRDIVGGASLVERLVTKLAPCRENPACR